MKDEKDLSRRKFLKKSAYVVPTIITLGSITTPAEASWWSGGGHGGGGHGGGHWGGGHGGGHWGGGHKGSHCREKFMNIKNKVMEIRSKHSDILTSARMRYENTDTTTD